MGISHTPASAIAAKKCPHRMGAVFTFVHQSDSRFLTSCYAAMLAGFKYNIRLGNFVSQYGTQENNGIAEDEQVGIVRHDIYFFTDSWINQSTGQFELIPDYDQTQWTAAGAAAFPVVAGATKTYRTPNHGAQLYALSNGQFGFNGMVGTSNLQEFKQLAKSQRDWLQGIINRVPSAGSYRNGEVGSSPIQYSEFLGMRNSSNGNAAANTPANTWYGKDENGDDLGYRTDTKSFREYLINFPSSTRFWDYMDNMGISRAVAEAYLRQELTRTITNRGKFCDFGHWHSMRTKNTLQVLYDFFAICRDTFGSNFVWTCSHGESLEYAYLRELCKSVSAFTDGTKVRIICEVEDKFLSQLLSGYPIATNLNMLNTPLSIEIDLTGTILSGKQVKCNSGRIRSLGSNKYIVQVPFRAKTAAFASVYLYEGTDGYFNEALPAVLSQAVKDGKVYVTTNLPVKSMMFSVNTGGLEYDSMPTGRTQQFTTEHVYPVFAGRDYRVGLISEFGMASLTSIQL